MDGSLLRSAAVYMDCVSTLEAFSGLSQFVLHPWQADGMGSSTKNGIVLPRREKVYEVDAFDGSSPLIVSLTCNLREQHFRGTRKYKLIQVCIRFVESGIVLCGLRSNANRK